MKQRHLLMGAALVGAAGLVLFGGQPAADGVARPVARPRPQAEPAPAAAPAKAAVADSGAGPRIFALRARAELLGEEGAGTAPLFGSQNWNPPPPPPSEAPPPPPPPSAPPLPFTVIGKTLSDGQVEVFLVRGERSFVVRANSVIDGSYRVDSIKPPMMSLTYLPLNQVQQLNIGVFD